MKQKLVYICEYCGKDSTSYGEIERCEASHLNISIGELREYREMQWRAEVWADIVKRSNSQKDRDAENRAILEVKKFEKLHGFEQGILIESNVIL